MILHCVQNLCLDINFEDNDDISAMHEIKYAKGHFSPDKTYIRYACGLCFCSVYKK